MKASASTLIASVFSLGKGREPAVEDLLRSNGLVIVIQDRAGAIHTPLEIPFSFTAANCCGNESLAEAQRKALRAYSGPAMMSIFPANIDLAA